MKNTTSVSRKRKLLEKMKQSDATTDPFLTEVSLYLKTTPTEAEIDNPIAFWKSRKGDFPLLSAMARKYLCISAASVAVECMFSVTGLILNSKRSSLAPWKMNYLSFVHDNYPVFFL